MGKTRSKQQYMRDGAFNDDQEKLFGSEAVCVILHGDAAISGQGVNQECLMTSYQPNYDIGGTIHLVINNQIGYTTELGRSSRYCTDIGKNFSFMRIVKASKGRTLQLFSAIFSGKNWKCPDLGKDTSSLEKFAEIC